MPTNFLPQQLGSAIAPQTNGGNVQPNFLQQANQLSNPQGDLIPVNIPQPAPIGTPQAGPGPIPVQPGGFVPGGGFGTGGTPAGPVPGPTDQGGPAPGGPPVAGPPSFGDTLGGSVTDFLNTPSRFDLPAVQQAFEFLSGDLQNQARTSASNIRADAASRGGFFSSVPNQSLFANEERLNRGLGDLATQLALAQAATQGQDRSASIASGLGFGRLGHDIDRDRANIGLQSVNVGNQGAPTIGGTTSQFQNIGNPQAQPGGFDPFSALGQFLQAQGQPAIPPTPAPIRPPAAPVF